MKVILLPGLWTPSPLCWAYQRSLRQQGYQTEIYSFSSTLTNWSQCLSRFQDYLHRQQQAVVVVAFSIGGKLLVDALGNAVTPRLKGLVLIACPLHGSAVVTHMAQHWYLRFLLGKALLPLLRTQSIPQQWKSRTHLILGNNPRGIARLIYRFKEESDSSVAFSEAYEAGCASVHVLPNSHGGLLFSRQVRRTLLELIRGFEQQG